MRDLLGSYGRYFNEVHGLVGQLFQHRFKSKPVERERHLLELVRYIPLNPVRAGLVKSPADWPWSSYLPMAGFAQVPDWLDVDATLSMFDPNDRRAAQLRFREFVGEVRDVEYDPHAQTINGWIIGSPEFGRRIQAWVDSRAPSTEHPERYRHVVRCSFDHLIDIVCRELGLMRADVFRRSHSPARKLIADLGHDECGVSFGQIGARFGITPWAAAKLRVRSRELSIRESDYAELLARTRKRLYATTDYGEKLLLQT
jgi:hypothetical protein